MREASPSARSDVRGGRRLLGADDVDRRHGHVVVVTHEVLLERQSTERGVEARRDRVVRDGQQSHAHAQSFAEFGGDVRLRGALRESLRTIEVRREVAVT